MQLDDVLVFLQIASSGSLTAASRGAAKPKATISHQLKRLEDEIGTPLFVRSANRLVLNDAGLDFLEHAKNIRRACERGLDAARRSRNVTIGTIRVGSGGEFTSNLIAPLVLHFARHHPQLRLEVMVLRGDALLGSRDSLDCILYLGEPPMPQVSELTARLLGRFSFGLYASKGYLEKHGTPSSPNELRSHDLIGFHNGENLTLWELQHDGKEFAVQPNARFLTNDYWVAKLAAIHDHGICFMPHFFAGPEVEAGILNAVLPEWKSLDIPMYALFSSHRLGSPNLRLLISSLSDNFEDIFSYLYTAVRSDSLTKP
ncbi:LysR family transcriptional regulator [Pseudaminobacter sp. 19-2017]|uniref:LysR family transcriptional regulator n=1 Tax=Pseudaminobacter soli (ex Zhang et al. 2022) TaxID=2831468 RepID=A0A942I407_9HYPH|nr:LysR family transcriptional regulator [Pseudaminobacter soli]